MSKYTQIQWCDSTCNPTMGCDGCELWNKHKRICYAGNSTERYKGKSPGYPARFEDVTQYPGRMAKAAAWKPITPAERAEKPWIPAELPRLIFISDMSDALSKAVPFDYLEREIIDIVAAWPHIGIWLTKRPRRMAEFSAWLEAKGKPWPRNLWALTSVTDQRTAEARIPELLKVGNAHTVRGISMEPLLGGVALQALKTPDGDLDALSGKYWNGYMAPTGRSGARLDWVIVGGESGEPEKVEPCSVEMIANVVADCRKMGVAVFVKQLGSAPTQMQRLPASIRAGVRSNPWVYSHMGGREPLNLKDPKGGDWTEWPAGLQAREFPRPK